jgi:UDPglucose--hexose-1-phosphate uridylyltransferase
MRTLKRERPELYPLIFNNHKAAAGASLEHVHIQIVALPKVPDLVEREIAAGRKRLEKTGQCLFCDLIVQERREGARIVRETENFLAVAAFAGRFPCELWLLPRRHASHFENIGDALLAELGQVFWELLHKLDHGLDDPAFNLIIHTAPPAGPALAEYHWHIEILPRLTGTAGFEWGTGMNINPVPPEQAAEYLRRQS